MIVVFKLKKIIGKQTPLMQEWWNVDLPALTQTDSNLLEVHFPNAKQKIQHWNPETIRMRYMSHILSAGRLLDEDNFVSMFDRETKGKVEHKRFTLKAGLTIGSGLMDYLIQPYFYLQDNKFGKDDEVRLQLLKLFLIAQTENEKAGKQVPLYGCEVIGKNWTFAIMESKEYCISPSLDATDKDDLLKIIAMLRKFKEILETRLLLI